jgi:hypothetical protein
MAGAISTGLSVASKAVDARSLARPFAILAIRSAVAGATTTRSALRDKLDVAHFGFIGQAEQVAVNLFAGEGRNRQRRNKFRARLCQDSAGLYAALGKTAHQFERLVGRDAATDDQKNAFAAHA